MERVTWKGEEVRVEESVTRRGRGENKEGKKGDNMWKGARGRGKLM